MAGIVLLVYIVVALRVISVKPLWHDEIFTIYLCRLPGMADVWTALATGLEQMPPFSHVISRAAYQLAGGGAFAIRLPSVIGFAVMAICLFAFLARRLPRSYALAGMLVPFFTGAAHFGYEGRSYGVVLGCTGVAMVAWQAVYGRMRKTALALLWLACAAAVSNHYYAVLILMPLGLGEIVRSVQRRRVDRAVWAALVLSLLPLVFFLPLIRSARSYAAAFWAKPGFSSIGEAYGRMIDIALPVLVALALLWFAYIVVSRRRDAHVDAANLAPELAVAGGFLALPLAMVAASFVTHAFEPRYSIWGVIGLALGISYAAYLTTAGSRAFGAAMAACLLAAFSLAQVIELRRVGHRSPEALEALEPLLSKGLPIVYADPLNYLQAAYYGSAELNARVFYVTDPAAALQRVGTDSPERALILLSRIAPLHLVPLNDFMAQHSHFLVLESGEFSWVVQELAARRKLVRVTEASTDVRTYEVLPGADATANK